MPLTPERREERGERGEERGERREESTALVAFSCRNPQARFSSSPLRCVPFPYPIHAKQTVTNEA